MTRRRFYFFSLWLPLIVPLLMWVGGMIVYSIYSHYFPPQSNPPPQTSPGNTLQIFGEILILLYCSLAMAGIQYVLFAIAVSIWFRRKSAYFIQCVSWALPVLFAPLYIMGIWLVFGNDRETWDGYSGITGVIIAFGKVCLLFGYAYVLLAHVLTFILTKIGFIKD